MLRILVIIATLATVAAVLRNRKEKSAGAKAAAIACAAVTIGLALVQILLSVLGGGGDPDETRARNGMIAVADAGVHGIGAYVATNFEGKRVLVIQNAGPRASGELTAFNAGLNGKAEVVDVVSASQTPDESGYVNAADFDQWISGAGCDVVVSLIGLPMDFPDMAFWGMGDGERPGMVLYGMDVTKLRAAIQGKIISAAIIPSPERGPAPNPAKSAEELFAEHYLVIDAQTLPAVTQKHPQLLHPVATGSSN